MGTPTYTALANITLGSSAASVTFSSISQLYRDLVLVMSPIPDSSGRNVWIKYNSDSGSNYNIIRMSGDGSSATSGAFANQTESSIFWGPTLSESGSMATVSIMDYSATDKHKTCLIRANASGYGTQAGVTRWASTSAVTGLVITQNGGTFSTGSTFALYGIAA